MDALKKAEQEKKEAAKRLKESEAENQPGGLDDTSGSNPEISAERNQPVATGSRLERTSTGENIPPEGLSLAPIDQKQDTAAGARDVAEKEAPPALPRGRCSASTPKGT